MCPAELHSANTCNTSPLPPPRPRAGSAVTSDVRYLPVDDPRGEWRVVLPRRNETEYSVEDRGDHLFITVRSASRGRQPGRWPAYWLLGCSPVVGLHTQHGCQEALLAAPPASHAHDPGNDFCHTRTPGACMPSQLPSPPLPPRPALQRPGAAQQRAFGGAHGRPDRHHRCSRPAAAAGSLPQRPARCTPCSSAM